MIRLKFGNPTLRQKLASTGDAPILLLNDWGDNIDGVCLDQDSGHWWGENRVGLILMEIREEAKIEAEQAQREVERAKVEADRRRSHYAPSVDLREKLVPTILSMIRFPKHSLARDGDIERRSPSDLLKFAQWQWEGLNGTEDIHAPKTPEALYIHALLRAALRAHDEYEFARAQQRGRQVSKSALDDDTTWRNAPLMTRQHARATFETLVPQLLKEQELSEIEVERFRQRVRSLTNSQWRMLFYNADVYMRVGAYEYARQTVFPTRAWHELDDALDGGDVPLIADPVFDQFYSDGLRVFHGYKDKDMYLAVPTRHDLEAEQVQDFMREEVSRIIQRERAALSRPQLGKAKLDEWRMVRPFDAEGLWAFDAKAIENETMNESIEKDAGEQ